MKKQDKKINLIEEKKKYRKHKLIKKSVIGLGILGLILILTAGYSKYHVSKVEHDRSAKVIENKQSVVMFYRDNCPYCHKIFAQVLAAKDAGIPVQFINTLNKTNREKYVEKYDIEYVPTLILLDNNGTEIQRYTGTNNKKINDLLHKAGGLK